MKSYEEQYQTKLTSPHHAVEHITSGDTIVYGMSIAQPPALLAALADGPVGGM